MAFLVNWFTVGIILIILEMLLPGMFLMWFGVSALLVGVITLIISMSINSELILFAITSVLSVITVILIMRKVSPNTQSTITHNLNQARGSEFIGMTFTLDSKVMNNDGKLNIGDTAWLIKGPDAEAGAHIEITHVENNTLIFKIID
ncbi:NfeD family protein [Wohlfahrtiimonas larvae]|uniref:NfeD family protein n=1 Tax=Wohlfahrtiimonas larvae TaxID=1157986 RepID=A0ABP9MGF9_9GAMM|nr:NfeD family protein [Wohlfahrtiimonas larvae]